MYSKRFYRILKRILDFVSKMTNIGDSELAPKIYTFKAFQYEEVKPREPMEVPYPRSGHRIGADSANLYSFGGYNPINPHPDENDPVTRSFPLFQELWKFNYAKKEWVRYPNSDSLPLELASNALVLHKNVLMVYGGTGSPFGYRCSNQLFVCRVNDGEGMMEEVQTRGQLPLPAYGQALIYHNQYIYTIGGTTGILYTCDIHRLNLKTLVWEIVYICRGVGDYEPTGRYRHEVAFDNKNIYVIGGGTALLAFDLRKIPVFNLGKKTWYRQKTLRDPRMGVPPPRRCHGAVQIQTTLGIEVYVVGGHDGENVFDDLWRLNLTTFQWTYFERCRLPYPTYFHAVAASPEGRLSVFGGIYNDSYDIGRSNSLFSMWLTIPKLSEMCWEAVLHYSPQIANCDSDELINVGLPRHFVQRLGRSVATSCREQ